MLAPVELSRRELCKCFVSFVILEEKIPHVACSFALTFSSSAYTAPMTRWRCKNVTRKEQWLCEYQSLAKPSYASHEDMVANTRRVLPPAMKVIGSYHLSNHCHTVPHRLHFHPCPRGQLTQKSGLWASLLCQAELPVYELCFTCTYRHMKKLLSSNSLYLIKYGL